MTICGKTLQPSSTCALCAPFLTHRGETKTLHVTDDLLSCILRESVPRDMNTDSATDFLREQFGILANSIENPEVLYLLTVRGNPGIASGLPVKKH